MWFNLDGDKRLGRCATQGCGGQPVYRLEVGGTGSNFCSGCRELIEGQTSRCFDALARPKIIGVDYGKSPAVSTEVEGYTDPDGTVHITAMRSWSHELELEAEPDPPRALGQTSR